ncbi:MAG: hypothetical protein FWG02_06545 [Holophagaceae bacterium]|nr:hypothetical protein [Holophagaceae bacterium]
MVLAKLPKKHFILFYFFSLLLTFGCGGGNNNVTESSTRSVTGVVTYSRLPIKVDSNGFPQGLDTPDNSVEMPLRGVYVRVVFADEETMPDESKVTVWRVYDGTHTNSDGEYTMLLPDDSTLPTFVEIHSVMNYSGYDVRIIADPAGINSQIPQADRVIYSLRKGIDGSSPQDNPMPAVALEGDVELDFQIGLDEKWWITHSSVKFAPDAQLESAGTGSKVAAILDTVYSASAHIGNPSPGGTLDLHYRQNITEPMGTYVEYDREKFPLAYEPSTSTGGGYLHFFGSVRGGAENEKNDAWDEGIILTMLARNSIRSAQMPLRFQFPPKKFVDVSDTRNALITSNLHPTMAMAEGLPEAMAAIVLKTPYLTSGSGTAIKDIRDISGLPLDIFCGQVITAFTWELALKANSINSPGDPNAWDKIVPNSLFHFYLLQNQMTDSDDSGSSEIFDLPSLFTQLKRLNEEYGYLESVNLSEVFTDAVISQMATPFFGNIWPRPKDGALRTFITDWGSDPDSTVVPIPSFILSMSDSELDAEGNYSNITSKQNFTSKFTLSKDVAYRLSVSADPPLPAGAEIEVQINGNTFFSYKFNSASPEPKRIVLIGNSDTPLSYLFDFRLISPKVKVNRDTTIAVRLDPSY